MAAQLCLTKGKTFEENGQIKMIVLLQDLTYWVGVHNMEIHYFLIDKKTIVIGLVNSISPACLSNGTKGVQRATWRRYGYRESRTRVRTLLRWGSFH